MSKVGFFILGLFCGVLLPSLYAWKQVDEANMAQPEVRVIKEYMGQFRGWQDDAINNESVEIARQEQALMHALTKKNRPQWSAYKIGSSGYCECNCQRGGSNLRL